MVCVVITSCSASKDDSVAIPQDSRVVDPSDYLEKGEMVSELVKTRERALLDPRAHVGDRETYAFDLYVRAGKAYSKMFRHHYWEIKRLLIESDDVLWFFLSAGYGIINALERARYYDAAFNRATAYKKDIPYTKDMWRPVLTEICEDILRKFSPEWVYVFGSRDYTQFIKKTSLWRERDIIKVFDSRGSVGVHWLSPKIDDLARSMLNHDLDGFNARHGKLTLQNE